MTDKKNIIWDMHRFMLPELPEAIRQQEKKNKLVNKPLLAEDKLEELNTALQNSMDRSAPIRLFYYKHGLIKSLFGVPIKTRGKDLVVLSGLTKFYIPLCDILDIQP